MPCQEDARNACSLGTTLALRRIGCLHLPGGSSWRHPASTLSLMARAYEQCRILGNSKRKYNQKKRMSNNVKAGSSLFCCVDVVGRPKSARAPGLIQYAPPQARAQLAEIRTGLGPPGSMDLESPAALAHPKESHLSIKPQEVYWCIDGNTTVVQLEIVHGTKAYFPLCRKVLARTRKAEKQKQREKRRSREAEKRRSRKAGKQSRINKKN